MGKASVQNNRITPWRKADRPGEYYYPDDYTVDRKLDALREAVLLLLYQLPADLDARREPILHALGECLGCQEEER